MFFSKLFEYVPTYPNSNYPHHNSPESVPTPCPRASGNGCSDALPLLLSFSHSDFRLPPRPCVAGRHGGGGGRWVSRPMIRPRCRNGTDVCVILVPAHPRFPRSPSHISYGPTNVLFTHLRKHHPSQGTDNTRAILELTHPSASNIFCVGSKAMFQNISRFLIPRWFAHLEISVNSNVC